MMKRFSAFVLCGFVLLSLVGCSLNNTDNADGTSGEYQSSIGEIEQSYTVFNTQNVERITFYSYYGYGTGSDVPTHHMAEIINWLDSFSLDKKIEDNLVPPGTNTVFVEIKYADGSVTKKGLDAIAIDDVLYYLKHDEAPECYWEILSHTSMP